MVHNSLSNPQNVYLSSDSQALYRYIILTFFLPPTELRVLRCNDILSTRGALSVLGCLPALRVLHLEGLHSHFDPTTLDSVGELTTLEELSVTSEEVCSRHAGQRLTRLTQLPPSWSSLKRVR